MYGVLRARIYRYTQVYKFSPEVRPRDPDSLANRRSVRQYVTVETFPYSAFSLCTYKPQHRHQQPRLEARWIFSKNKSRRTMHDFRYP